MLMKNAATLRALVRAKVSKLILIGGAVACIFVPQVMSQTANTGSISGTVTEQSGAVVPQAKVTATAETGLVRSTVSGPQGNYVLPLLPPGTYKVDAAKAGFKAASYPKIQVNITETKVLPVRLELGAVSEIVTVNAQGEALQTESSALGHVTTGDEIRSLPLVTGNYTQIIGLSPGVSSEVFNAGEIGRGGVDDAIVVSGAASSDNNFQMNGVEINDLQGSGHFSGGIGIPNPESIQEFKVQTSQYDASYGRDAGGNVDVLTKGGTNRFHGSLFEYFRNEALNANEFFRKQNNQPRPILRQNQFGFAIGGPIMKDKLLFFGSYQGTRQLNGVDPNCSSDVVLPPLTDDRSAAAIETALGPDPLPGPVTPQALAIFNFKLPNGQFLIPTPQTIRPDPNTPGAFQGFSSFSIPCTYNENQFVSNLDYLQSDKSRFEGRFFFANNDQNITLPQTHFTGTTLPGSPSSQPTRYRNLSLAHTYIFTSHLVNQAEFGFHQVDSRISQETPFKFSDVGISAPGFINDLPVVDVIGGFNIGGNGQAVHFRQNTFVFQDNLSWVRGKHSFKFGGSLTRVHNDIVKFDFAGFLAFLNYQFFTSGIIPLSEDIAGDLNRQFRIWDSSLFVQDDYKISPRLTLNLGFRYERLGDFSDARGHTSTLDPEKVVRDPGAGGSLAGFIVGSDYRGPMPDGVVKAGNDLAIKGNGQNTLNPRIGFAWRIPGTERVVLRGGYGIFHQRVSGQPYVQQLTNQPFGLVQVAIPNFTGDISNPFLGDPGAFPQFIPYQSTLDPTQLQSVFTLDQNIRPPIFQRYSFNIQTEVAKDFVLELGYAGARGQHLVRIRSLNQALVASPENPIRGETDNTLANIQQRAPFQGFTTTNFSFAESKGASWFNSLQASLNKRFSHGFQFLGSYTFARYLADNISATTGANGGTVIGDQNDFHSVYGPDDFLREHRFVLSGIYDLPSPHDRTSLLGQVLGGWRLSGVGTIQSGRRLTVTDADPFNVFGTSNNFAQYVPGCKANLSSDITTRLSKYFDTGCFTKSPDAADGHGFGNSPVGIIRGPGQVNTDLSVLKIFPLRKLTESTNLEFRADFFNLFNHPQFDIPDTEKQSTSSFGQVTRTIVSPRVIQFALKLNF